MYIYIFFKKKQKQFFPLIIEFLDISLNKKDIFRHIFKLLSQKRPCELSLSHHSELSTVTYSSTPASPQQLYLLTLYPAEKEACSIPCSLLCSQAKGKHERGWSGHGLNTQTLYTEDGPKAHQHTQENTHTHWCARRWRGLGGLRITVGGADGEGRPSEGW